MVKQKLEFVSSPVLCAWSSVQAAMKGVLSRNSFLIKAVLWSYQLELWLQ